MARRFSKLQPRQIAVILGVAALAVLVGAAGYGATTLFGAASYGATTLFGAASPPAAPSNIASAPPAGAGQQGGAGPAEVAVRSRLVFPAKAELSFETAGEIAEILVAEGDRVTAGQTLARLKADTFPALEEELARLRYNISQTRDTIRQLNLDFSGEPLLVAQRAETVAQLEYANLQTADFLKDIDRNHNDALVAARQTKDQAILNLDRAQEDLAEARQDLDADHQQVLAQAFQGRADAELALDNARQRLTDYTDDIADNTVRGQDRVAKAELALDLAKEALKDYRENLSDNTVRGQDRVTEAELAVDLTKDALADFTAEHSRLVIRARTRVGAAEVALDAAEDALTQFVRSPTRDLQADNKPIDIPRLRRLQADVALAESELAKAREDLAELEEGPDPLRLQELESNVTVAELNLTQARKDLTELEEGPDPLRLQELESNVTIAELNLAQAKDDVTELEEGPDPLIVKELQTAVDLARVVLSQAEKNLAEELEGPDRLNIRRLNLAVELAQTRLGLADRDLNELIADGPNRDAVPLRELEVAARLAQIADLDEPPDALQIAALEAGIVVSLERMDDILEDMEKTELRAPFDGVVYLVNAAVEDRVNKESRILEVLDPGQVAVAGLVDGNDYSLVRVGSAARVNIAALPGQELTGTVTAVAAEPGTERGVISYPVTIRVNLPAGVELPPRLSAVTSVILP